MKNDRAAKNKNGHLLNIDARNKDAITAFNACRVSSKFRQRYRPSKQLDQSLRSECGGNKGTNN